MTDDRPFESSFPRRRESRLHWIPAFAGMTVVLIILLNSACPANWRSQEAGDSDSWLFTLCSMPYVLCPVPSA
jgi:hypothetical protein